jgi:hypothetical protein
MTSINVQAELLLPTWMRILDLNQRRAKNRHNCSLSDLSKVMKRHMQGSVMIDTLIPPNK